MLWHEHLRRSAKLMAMGGLYCTGLLSLTRRSLMKNRALILMYHRVNPAGYGAPDYSPVGMSVTPREFEMQMSFLRKNYDVVPLSRIVDAVTGKQPFSANMCAVTFDDGWQDVYEFAFPVLKRHSIPAMVYLTSGFINGEGWFWEERVKYLLSIVHQSRDSTYRTDQSAIQDLLLALGCRSLSNVSRSGLSQYLLDVGRRLKRLSPALRENFMSSLEAHAAPSVAAVVRPFLSPAEVREMADFGVEFGNHTQSHSILPELSDEELSGEVLRAAAGIKSILGTDVSAFAYPYGKYDERVRNCVESLGQSSASTTRFGLVESGADPFALNRINICSDIAGRKPLFAARILGI